MTGAVVGRIRANEWEKARTLRLAALADPAAPIAFLDTLEDALQRPPEFWMARAAGSAEGPAGQFVAELPDGTWIGSATVLVFGAGDVDYAGLPVVARRAYERTGFVETGDVVVTAIGADVVMTARLR